MAEERDQQISPEFSKLKELEAKLDIYKSTLTEIYEQYDQKLEELSLVRRMGDALRATGGLEGLSRSLLATVAHEVSVDRLALMLTQEKRSGDQLFIRAAYWADHEIFSFFEPNRAIPWSLSTLGELAPADSFIAPLAILSAAPEYDPLGRPDDSERALVFLPLTVRQKLLGLLALSRPAGRPFSPEDERMLAIMSDQAGSALSNVLLFDDLSRVNLRLMESESRARQVSSYLQRLFESANDAIFTLNHEGVITYANRKAAQWGWTLDEMMGKEFRGFLADPERIRGWAPGTPPPADEIFEATLMNAAGERRDLILSTSRVGDDESGRAAGVPRWPAPGGDFGETSASWMVLASDMTDRKYLERQLIHSEKLASIGLLAAGVAHEVGNPLSAISGYAQILEAGVTSETEQREYLEAIVNQTGRIQKILRELLDYSRPSQGMSELFDLGEALPRTMSMVKSQRVFRGIAVEFELDEAHRPHLVAMDRDHLAQITIIIAMNAAQAMTGEGAAPPEPGQAAPPKRRKTAAEPQENSFKVALRKSAGWVHITFTDNGPGIPAKLIDRLFDPFFTTKTTGQGTGLGLSICQRLVDSYQGRISVNSREGRGAAFTISLPEAPEQDTQSP
ncbi:MAG: GAF domain-containing protein [Candidatus Adiutrix sp.]|jgi:PAS domain S-box-containing protein|nr:GAF domain-containing protein [Candidatus Adiutrix sp.]